MIIYQASYCPCIHESVYGTMSLHLSREGAEKAIAEHKEKIKKEHDEMVARNKEEFTDCAFDDDMWKWDAHQDWHIYEIEVQD